MQKRKRFLTRDNKMKEIKFKCYNNCEEVENEIALQSNYTCSKCGCQLQEDNR